MTVEDPAIPYQYPFPDPQYSNKPVASSVAVINNELQVAVNGYSNAEFVTAMLGTPTDSRVAKRDTDSAQFAVSWTGPGGIEVGHFCNAMPDFYGRLKARTGKWRALRRFMN